MQVLQHHKSYWTIRVETNNNFYRIIFLKIIISEYQLSQFSISLSIFYVDNLSHNNVYFNFFFHVFFDQTYRLFPKHCLF